MADVAAVSPAPKHNIFMPTQEMLKRTYGNIVLAKEKSHTLRSMSRPPVGVSSAPKYDITAKGSTTKKEVFLVRGELYLKTTEKGSETSKWFKAGPAPVFMANRP